MAFRFRVDHQLRLLAVFSPKCASNSIHRWMDLLAGATGRDENFTFRSADYIEPFQIHDYDGYHTVLFLRDPMRRLVSFYTRWVVKEPGIWDFADDERRFGLQGKSFRQFMYVLDHLDRHGLAYQHHLEPQTMRLPEFQFRHVVLTEQLSAGFQKLNDILGVQVGSPRRHQTRRTESLQEFVGDRRPGWLAQRGIPVYGWFFDRDMARLGRRLYAADFDLYAAHGGLPLEPLGQK